MLNSYMAGDHYIEQHNKACVLNLSAMKLLGLSVCSLLLVIWMWENVFCTPISSSFQRICKHFNYSVVYMFCSSQVPTQWLTTIVTKTPSSFTTPGVQIELIHVGCDAPLFLRWYRQLQHPDKAVLQGQGVTRAWGSILSNSIFGNSCARNLNHWHLYYSHCFGRTLYYIRIKMFFSIRSIWGKYGYLRNKHFVWSL